MTEPLIPEPNFSRAPFLETSVGRQAEPRSWDGGRASTSAKAPRPGMIWIEGGEFLMGSERHYPEEAPVRHVAVDGFWIDEKPVTNRQFDRFVRATGWKTTAERPVDPALYPDSDAAMLEPASVVFVAPQRQRLQDLYDWWRYIKGADWRRPSGPASSIRGMEEHPVVHVSLEDVRAYAAWAGGVLPTEAEWEYAARGGLEGADFAWGDELAPGGRHLANTWQGEFPFLNSLDDGWPTTSPVGVYPPNGYGLYDMIGNVWEWTDDWWSSRHIKGDCCGAVKNPRGGPEGLSLDPGSPDVPIPRKVLKGGSHLCAPNYCRRYRPAARHAHPVDTATSHIGFRLVVRT